MILHPLPAVETGGAGGLDDGLEIPVVRVAEHLGEVPAGPEFIARRVRPADGFEGGDFVAHGGRILCILVHAKARRREVYFHKA